MLSMAWREEMRANPPRRDGHVETVSQRHQCSRAASRNPVRQVPHHSPPGRSPRSSAKERVRAPVGKKRRFIKGQKYTLLSRKENLTLEGRQALRTLLRANKRLNTAYVLKESFGQLWSYEHEGSSRTGARRSNGRD